jgi:hypothetical protein
MIAEKTITICGKEVQMRYCAASETGYELLSNGKSSEVFTPKIERDDNGEVVKVEPPKATADDYIKLAIASIIASYERNDEETPISGKDIMYDAEPQEISELITSVIELRNKWYAVPKTVPDSEFEESDDEKQKNAQPPASDSNAS